MVSDMQNIHEQLKTIRKGSGIIQKSLAAAAECTQKQVSNIEGGQDCYVSTLRNLLMAMGYDLAAVPVGKKEGGEN